MAEIYEIETINELVRGLIRDKLKTDGKDIFEYDSNKGLKFYLSEDFVSNTTINVYQNGTLLDEDDWEYILTDNSVVIDFDTSGEALVDGDIVLLTYSYYSKYSDNEIKGYIKSALTYFAEFKYAKIFEINSDDEIVSVNGTNPTYNECYFIAIITAIHIEPENVNIRTKEFSITSTQDKSKKEQITDAFNRFTSFIGEIEFIEDEEE